jgi:Transposase DDE domain
MSDYSASALAMLTEFFTTDTIEQTARRHGFVKRTSKITGKLFVALVTFGLWSHAKTTLSQLAMKVTQLGTPQSVSAEAIHQRMNKRAVAFLQDLIQQTLAKIQALNRPCEDGVFQCFTRVYLCDSTGFGLPECLKTLFPGSGGKASPAGAKIQLVWEYKRSLFAHFALTAGNLPDQKYVENVVALAQRGSLFLFDLGYFKIKAFAAVAQVGAYFLSRLNHQANLYEGISSQLPPLDLVKLLKKTSCDLIDKDICIGEADRVVSRLIAARLPDDIVNERCRVARAKAKKKGYNPTEAHLFLLGWNLFITNVPRDVWTLQAAVKAYPMRWQLELIFKSWKSHCHLSAINAKKKETVLCYLYGRMLLVLLTYALYPQVRSVVWTKQHRELSLLKFVSHFQALADSWMKVIFESELVLRRFLQAACAEAERLALKASRKRRTSAQTLRESVEQQTESLEVTAAINA